MNKLGALGFFFKKNYTVQRRRSKHVYTLTHVHKPYLYEHLQKNEHSSDMKISEITIVASLSRRTPLTT
jgi:hypothetical protein